ncbi:MAG: hypothetical protein IKG86_05975 [Paludibacteraceae bacterium]|nr:hypothetical protein [Paludibacteraceae bacterium]
MENPRQQIDTNPWKGLNFYSEIDRNNFYGRDEEIQSLSLYITNNIQTILYGKSGIGKSSIIYAGVFPAARQAGLFPISIRFSHDEKTNYIDQIRLAFEKAGIGITERVPRIEGHEESLWEFMHRHSFLDPVTDEPTRPLIVLDQFEEIFTLQKDEKKKLAFFAELADMLNGVTPQYIVEAQSTNTSAEKKTKKKGGFVLDLGTSNEDEAENDYINESLFNLVFVIREDFLSYMERYTKFIPVMKTNRYALLPLNEEQAADIIMKPQPGLVSKDVAKLIIQKVTSRTDFELEGTPEIEVDAAVLSLFLSGLYRKKEEQGLQTITAELVNQAGEFIIRDFYMDSINGLSEHDIEVLEDELLTSDGRRNNVSKNDLIGEGLSEEAIKDLVENQKLLRQFSYQDDIRIEYMHDILCPVVSERIEQRENAKRMEAERLRQEEEQRRLLAEEQRKREAIEAKAKADKERLEKEAIEAKQKSKKRMYGSVAALLIIGAIFGIYYILFQKTYSAYYANFTTENGWPIGVGKSLNPGSEEVKKANILQLYKLTKEGLYTGNKLFEQSPYKKVEVVSPSGKSICNMLYETPVVGLIETEFNDVKSREFAKLQRLTTCWIYRENSAGEVDQVTAYGKNDSSLYSIQYYRDNDLVSLDSSLYTLWARFYDATGRPMTVSDKGTDRIRQTIHNGLVTSNMFFTELEVPQRDAYNNYGYTYDNDEKSKLIHIRYSVNKFGDRIDSTALTFHYDEFGRVDSTSYFKVAYPKQGMIVYQFKHFCDTLQYRSDGSISQGAFHTPGGKYSYVAFKYDEKNNILLNQKHKNGKLVEYTRHFYDSQNRYDSIIRIEQDESFVERYNYPKPNVIEVSLWKNGHRYETLREINEYGDSICYHTRRTTETKDSVFKITNTEYLDTCGKLVDDSKGLFAKVTIKKELQTNRIKLEYYYLSNGEDIYKSSWFDYDDYGRQTARAVAGIDGDPIRCPEWDWDGWCYYKMSLLAYHNDIVYFAMEGYDEFGDEAYVLRDSSVCSISPTSPDELRNYTSTYNYLSGILLAKCENKLLSSKDLVKIPFLHILNKEGTMYAAKPQENDILEGAKHPKDGDVLYHVGNWHLYQSEALLKTEWGKLVKTGGQIEILRAEGIGKKGFKKHYVKHIFDIEAGPLGAKYYTMPITQSQQNRIKHIKL